MLHRRLNLSLLSLRRDARLQTVLYREEIANLKLLGWLRTGAVGAIALWLVLVSRGPRLTENLVSAALFAALGWIYLALVRNTSKRPWYAYAFAVIDALILVDNLLPVMPWNAPPLPFPVLLRFGSFAFLFLPLGLAAFFYSPLRTLWSALATALVWSAAVAWILMQPGAFIAPHLTMLGVRDPMRFMADFFNPDFVDIGSFETDLFVLLLMGALLSIVVWRTRRLVLRQMTAERNRAQLAHYFSPNLIDALQAENHPFDSVRNQEIGVLFADIVGFTRMAERLSPERTIALLRSFHRRMAKVVFAHGGTLDKYIGDAVMATFGTPNTGPQDAVNALLCARAMIEELARWNDKRIARGAEPIRVGIGVHYGPAVLGDIGDERRLEFAVIGDTVNVASRVERLTRVIGVDILISQDLVDAAERQSPEQAASALVGFEQGRPRVLRGRRGPVALWAYRRVLVPAAAAGKGAA